MTRTPAEAIRYVVVADYNGHMGLLGEKHSVVVDALPCRPWLSSPRVGIRGDSFVTWCTPDNLRNPRIEEVAWNDPLLLGPFNRYHPHGVQHYPTPDAARRNLERLVLAAKKSGLRSSATEQPLRKRQVEGLSPSGGSKWIRRQQYARAVKTRWLEEWAAKGAEWATKSLAKQAVESGPQTEENGR